MEFGILFPSVDSDQMTQLLQGMEVWSDVVQLGAIQMRRLLFLDPGQYNIIEERWYQRIYESTAYCKKFVHGREFYTGEPFTTSSLELYGTPSQIFEENMEEILASGYLEEDPRIRALTLSLIKP